MSILAPTQEHIQKAATLLARGDLVAIPTETVYGLAARADDEEAVKKIFALKGRPATNPLIVHMASASQVEQVAHLSSPSMRKRFEKLSAQYWPGPLSIVLPRNNTLPRIVTGGGDWVATRVPKHPVAQALLQACSFPLAAPSANRSNRVSPTLPTHVEDEFGDSLLILDGGPCAVGIESTVVKLTEAGAMIVRPGVITAESVSETLQESLLVKDIEQSAGSPGQLTVHYAPDTPLYFLNEVPQIGRIGVITFSSGIKNPPGTVVHKHFSSLNDAATSLYATLREFDRSKLDAIAVELPTGDGLAAALRDRLTRAAAQGKTRA